ncbi:hypothetical protein BSZ35_19005, partial [Salinibacter sp. 10B]|uniref:hypothetical protein n=1 Tax=Salinibacter sp. 10B TaxID=1923971 RepID=UPI000D2755F5
MAASIVEGVQLRVQIDGDETTIKALGQVENAQSSVEESAKSMEAAVIESSQSAGRAVESMGDSAEESAKSMETLQASTEGTEKRMESLESAASDTGSTVERSMSRIADAAQRPQREMQELSSVTRRLESSNRSMTSSVQSSASALGFEMVQGLSDARFGVVGLANQIPLMSEQWQRLRQETGSTKGALGALISTFGNPAVGLIGAITLLLTYEKPLMSF